MFKHISKVAAVLLLVPAAHADTVVKLRCDFKEQGGVHAHWSTVIADQAGISITDYSANPDGTTGYVKAYTTNKKEEARSEYYRINSAEIAWGSQSTLGGVVLKLDSSIDLGSGVEKDDVVMFMKGDMKQRPTNTGYCKSN